MKKITILFLAFICTLNISFAITTDITFHNKFEKNESLVTIQPSYSGFISQKFSQTNLNLTYIRDSMEDEYDYYDAKKLYNEERKGHFGTKLEHYENIYKFEKNYQNTEYKEYKKRDSESNWARKNYFNQNNEIFTSSESYSRNDY